MTTLDRTLHLVLQGATNKEIAAELNVATRTAKAYIHDLFIRHGIGGPGGRRGRLIALAAGSPALRGAQRNCQSAICVL